MTIIRDQRTQNLNTHPKTGRKLLNITLRFKTFLLMRHAEPKRTSMAKGVMLVPSLLRMGTPLKNALNR